MMGLSSSHTVFLHLSSTVLLTCENFFFLSPNLNIIEAVWDHLDRERNKGQPCCGFSILFSASFKFLKFSYKDFLNREDEAEIFPKVKTLFHSFKIKSRDFVHKTLKIWHFSIILYTFNLSGTFSKKGPPVLQCFLVIDPWPYHLFHTLWAS